MRMFRGQTRPITHYQQVKSSAARNMLILGTISTMFTVASLFIGNFSVVLFLAGISAAFFLVGYQQQIDAIAAGDEVAGKRGQNGEEVA